MAEPWVKNAAGVKDGCDCYRTINGVRYDWWPAGNADRLREAGVRCRRSKGEVFIHPDDEEKAWSATWTRAPDVVRNILISEGQDQ